MLSILDKLAWVTRFFKIMAKAALESDNYFSSFWFAIDPAQTHFLRFIFEGYGNEFQMTTVSKEHAVVRVLAMKGSEAILIKILKDLNNKIGVKSVPLEYIEALKAQVG